MQSGLAGSRTGRLNRRELFAVGTASLAASGFIFSEYLPPFKTVHLWSDIAGYHYPLHLYAFSVLKQGRFPQWDPSIYCGVTFVGNIQAALFYPFTWLAYLVSSAEPRLPFKVIEVLSFAQLWAGFLLCYVWLRRAVGVLASLLGSATFAWSGFLMHQLLHPGVFGTFIWTPLACIGVDEAAQKKSWRPLWKVSLACAFAFLAGYPSAWLALVVGVLVYAACSGSLRLLAGAAGAVLFSSMLAAVQFCFLPWKRGR